MAIDYFTIRLGVASYDHGFINPGVAVDRHFGPHHDATLIHFLPATATGVSVVNTFNDRHANQNGTVRLNSRAAVCDWFQQYFARGNCVLALIEKINEITLITPDEWNKPGHRNPCLPISHIGNTQTDWDKLKRRIEDLIRSGYRISCLAFMGGGSLAIPDWFRDWCKEHGIKVKILEPDAFKHHFGPVLECGRAKH